MEKASISSWGAIPNSGMHGDAIAVLMPNYKTAHLPKRKVRKKGWEKPRKD
jgi:hypothetical protein